MVCLRVRRARMVMRGTAARSGRAAKTARRVSRRGVGMRFRISIRAAVDDDGGGARSGGIGGVLGEQPGVEGAEGVDAAGERAEGGEAGGLFGEARGERIGVDADIGDGVEVEGTGRAGTVEGVDPAEG